MNMQNKKSYFEVDIKIKNNIFPLTFQKDSL